MRNDLPPDYRPEEMERNAYNAAFDELGLCWHWDRATWAALQGRGRQCVRHYLETEQAHLLSAYDAEFLVQAIERTKAETRRAVEGNGRMTCPF